jgi:flagellar hook-associated protein 2
LIRITDRAGNVADINLRAARTIDDVLAAINNNSDVSITASVSGDALKLTDTSGGSGNLRVQNVGGGTTATGLGLASINVAASTATGSDVLTLHSGTKLAQLNDGTGVELQSGNDLHFTFRDETTLDVDLGAATTLGEVLTAINAANPAKLSAVISADGNRLQLTDLTTGAGTFSASNVGTGSAAKSLGLTTTAAGGTITGRRLISGLRDTLVGSLNGGQGLGTLGVVNITNRNSVLSNVNLSAAETLADVVAAINAQATGVTASINSVRNGIVLTDTTGATASNFIVANGDANNSATALGIVANVAATTVNSGSLDRQQLGRATLLSSLNQGEGIDLGDITIVDTAGNIGAVDLNTAGNEAKTLGDVIDRINALSSTQVEARINATGDGILLVDQAGGSGTLEVKEVGIHTTARDLRLLGTGVAGTVDGLPATVIDGTSRFSVDLSDFEDPGATIKLSSLNGGTGVSKGAFKITDTNGDTAAIVLSSTDVTTDSVADVIAAINAKTIGVEARINSAGTGILLFDTAFGAETLKVEDLNDGDTAADLGLDAKVKDVVIDSVPRQAIDGAGTFSQSVAQSALDALADQINDFEAGITANAIFDGSGYRLSLTVDEAGAGNEILVDGLSAGLSFDELSVARDAAVEFGGSEAGSGLLLTSSKNTFDSIVPGVEITVVKASEETITVEVAKSATSLLETAQDFVDAFNSIQKNLDEATAFDEEELTTGILFGTTAALRVETDINGILSGRFFGVGNFTSLEAIGLSFHDEGKLSLNSGQLAAAFEKDPVSLEKLFTHETLGLGAQLGTVLEQLAGESDSVLSARSDTLSDTITSNTERIESMDARLERERERLFNQFALLESTIASLQQNFTALSSLRIVPPLSINRNNNR